jgi:hypothetical protein
MHRRPRRPWAILLAAFGVLLLAAPREARADETPRPYSLGFVVRRGTLSPTFSGSNFKGTGTDESGDSHTLSASGVGLGILRPPVHVYDFGVDMDFDAFHGGLFFGIGKTSADGPARDPASQSFDTSNLTYFRLGAELGTSYWIGGHLRLTAATMLGFQAMQMDLYGLTKKCKSGTCNATANALLPWLQPRLGFEVLLGDHTGVGVGAYLGTDVLRPQDFETGITISIRTFGYDPPLPARPAVMRAPPR